MKIYCFYLYDKVINPKDYPGIAADTIQEGSSFDYSLYAFTPEKESREYFKATRNMKKFFEKIITIDRSDYEDFCSEYDGHLLEYHAFKTKKVINNRIESVMFRMLSTRYESDLILYYSEEVFERIITDCLTPRLVEMIQEKVLNKKLLTILNNSLFISSFIDQMYPTDDFPSESYEIDELGLYCAVFKNTFIKDRS